MRGKLDNRFIQRLHLKEEERYIQLQNVVSSDVVKIKTFSISTRKRKDEKDM